MEERIKDAKGTEKVCLETLEKKYGKVKVITVGKKVETQVDPKDASKEIEVEVDPGKTCYLRPLDRATMKFAHSKQVRADGSIDSISPGELILNKCWIAGDEEIKTNNKLWFPACIECTTHLQEESGLF